MNGNSFKIGPRFVAMDTNDFGSNFQWRMQLLDPDTGELGPGLTDQVTRGPLANGSWLVTHAVEENTLLWDPETDRQVEILACEVQAETEAGSVPYCTGDSEPSWWLPVAAPDGQNVLAWGSSEIRTFTP